MCWRSGSWEAICCLIVVADGFVKIDQNTSVCVFHC